MTSRLASTSGEACARNAAEEASAFSCWRIRTPSSRAAFLVKVKPRTSSGRIKPLATNHTTRAAIVAVLPAPAPATTSIGSIGAPITAACCGVGGKSCPIISDRVTGSMMVRSSDMTTDSLLLPGTPSKACRTCNDHQRAPRHAGQTSHVLPALRDAPSQPTCLP